jgi:hypothetical protein
MVFLLSDKWTGCGPKSELAVCALLGAKQGRVKPDTARQAFVNAAIVGLGRSLKISPCPFGRCVPSS